jgi:hypothetical protein
MDGQRQELSGAGNLARHPKPFTKTDPDQDSLTCGE